MNFGNIVLVIHPATDYKNVKIRPALIISSDSYNNRESDRIVLPISSNISRPCPDDIIIYSNNKWFKDTGLKVSSAICTGKILTLDKKVIKRNIGQLSGEIMAEVKEKLREIFVLS